MINYDVAVIGAGPAGSTAAGYCARHGLKTLLLDRCIFPRPKTCGGGITTAALNSIGYPLPQEIILDSVQNLRSVFGQTKMDIGHPRPFMITVDRSLFDNFLAEKAVDNGADFIQQASVTGLNRDNGIYNILTPQRVYKSRVVIAADGVHSTAARSLGFNIKSLKPAFCLVLEVPVSAGHSLNKVAQIYYNLLPKGYGWIFPKGDRLSIGVGGLDSRYERLRETLTQLAGTLGIQLPAKVTGEYIPFGRWTRNPVADGFVLTGDAAGFVDPFTGEGIRFAIQSGMLAAETVWDCYKRNLPPQKNNLEAYRRKCSQAFLKDFRYSLLLSRTFFAFPSTMHRYLFSNEYMYHRFLRVLEGSYSYRELVRDVLVGLPKYCISRTCQTQV